MSTLGLTQSVRQDGAYNPGRERPQSPGAVETHLPKPDSLVLPACLPCPPAATLSSASRSSSSCSLCHQTKKGSPNNDAVPLQLPAASIHFFFCCCSQRKQSKMTGKRCKKERKKKHTCPQTDTPRLLLRTASRALFMQGAHQTTNRRAHLFFFSFYGMSLTTTRKEIMDKHTSRRGRVPRPSRPR